MFVSTYSLLMCAEARFARTVEKLVAVTYPFRLILEALIVIDSGVWLMELITPFLLTFSSMFPAFCVIWLCSPLAVLLTSVLIWLAVCVMELLSPA